MSRKQPVCLGFYVGGSFVGYLHLASMVFDGHILHSAMQPLAMTRSLLSIEVTCSTSISEWLLKGRQPGTKTTDLGVIFNGGPLVDII